MPVNIVKRSMDQVCNVAEVFKFNIETYKLCAADWISQLLSAGILAGSVALKLPQIFNIVMSGDVEGISPESFYSEVPLTVNNVMYNFRKGYPFMSYGESAIVMVQNFILVVVLWKYMTPSPTTGHILTVLGTFAAITLLCAWIPESFLYLLPLAGFPLMIYSRLMQIISNYRLRTTGQLSSITTLLTFLGSAARVFTTIQQVGWDMNIISGFVVSTVLAGILLFQIIYYSVAVPKKTSSKDKKED